MIWNRIQSLFKATNKNGYKRWQCLACRFIYDEAEGWPEDGIPAGTPWQDVPEDWVCPDCNAKKTDFEMIRMG